LQMHLLVKQGPIEVGLPPLHHAALLPLQAHRSTCTWSACAAGRRMCSGGTQPTVRPHGAGSLHGTGTAAAPCAGQRQGRAACAAAVGGFPGIQTSCNTPTSTLPACLAASPAPLQPCNPAPPCLLCPQSGRSAAASAAACSQCPPANHAAAALRCRRCGASPGHSASACWPLA
jgi:hypothetical protein